MLSDTVLKVSLVLALLTSSCAFAQGVGGTAGIGGKAGIGGGPSAGGGGGGGNNLAKGTAVTCNNTGAAATTCVTGTLTAASGALLTCSIAYDDNSSGTVISSISIAGSPTYSTAWATIDATNGRQFTNGTGGTEVWFAVASSAISGAVTITISSSEKNAAVCQSYTGQAASPIGTVVKAAANTVSVTSSGSDHSFYAGAATCLTNNGVSPTAGTGFTLDATPANSFDNTNTKWANTTYETINSSVSPAANTTVNITVTGTCVNAQIVGFEIKD